MILCCEVNPIDRCSFCKQKVCKLHRAGQESCVNCYLTMRQLAEKEAVPRQGMSFQDLYFAARRLVPQGYLTISVTLNDHKDVAETAMAWHSPTVGHSYEWNVYHEKEGHSSGSTPEAALLALQYKLGLIEESKIDV